MWGSSDVQGAHARCVGAACMQTRCNAVAWNPMEAFNFTVANEDCNLYTYDMRKLSIASCLHKARLASRSRWHHCRGLAAVKS